MSSAYFMLKFLEKRRRRQLSKTDKRAEICAKEVQVINKCRICMKEANISIFSQGSSFDIAEAIRIFAGIELSEEDNYPKHICNTCHAFIQNAILFRKSAQDMDKLLRQTAAEDYDDFDAVNDADDNNQYNYESSLKSHDCKQCKLNFSSWEELVTHKSSKKHKNVRIQCPICYGLLTAQLYKKHLARHQSASHLICDICGKLYRKDNLVRHLQLHSYELPFQCQICPYRGRFMESLKIHMRTHTGDKPFSCDKCELRFLTRSNLNRHLLTHKKERPFKCVECGRGFYTKRDMDAHFKADHAGLKEFSCRMCGNKYGTRKALMRHELRVHKRDKMAKGRVPLYLQAEYQKQIDDDLLMIDANDQMQ